MNGSGLKHFSSVCLGRFPPVGSRYRSRPCETSVDCVLWLLAKLIPSCVDIPSMTAPTSEGVDVLLNGAAPVYSKAHLSTSV